jgi:hypothetical protein
MKIPYRPEIDGLRAIAVCSIIIYHSQISFLDYEFLIYDYTFIINQSTFDRDLMYKLSVLFLCKKNDKYSNLCNNYLVTKFNKVKTIATNGSKKDLTLLKWRGDLIILFISKIILKKNIIKKQELGT